MSEAMCHQGQWGVAKVLPSRGTRFVEEGSSRGLVAYSPLCLVEVQRRGTLTTRTAPLFPGYAFVELNGMWRVAYELRDFLGFLLADGENPSRVPAGVVEEIRGREGADGFIRLPRPRRRFRKGQLVRVKAGPLAGLKGIVAGMSSRDRVRVLLDDVLGRQTPATLQEAALTVA